MHKKKLKLQLSLTATDKIAHVHVHVKIRLKCHNDRRKKLKLTCLSGGAIRVGSSLAVLAASAVYMMASPRHVPSYAGHCGSSRVPA